MCQFGELTCVFLHPWGVLDSLPKSVSLSLIAPVLVQAGLCSGMACFYVIFFHTDYKRLHAETVSADLAKAEDAVTTHVPES